MLHLRECGCNWVPMWLAAIPGPAPGCRAARARRRHFVLHDIGDGDYKELLERFGSVTAVFATLDTAHRAVIADITKRMGAGMAEFIDKDVETVADYDLYCHYVAGAQQRHQCGLTTNRHS